MIFPLKTKALSAATVVTVLSGGLSLSSMVQAGVTQADIDNDAKTTGDVVSWGMGQQGQRYSPLKKINKGNVKKLVPAWSFSFGGEKQRGQEAQPVIHNGRIFVTGSYSRLYAIDAKSGEELWQYDHRLPDGILPCCDVINRGAALHGDLVIFGTLDARLVALDQATGKVKWRSKID
ncbi:MAG: PQQ-binding-like beta-propeller repeat protein, partial [Candidatus Thiodiazotropha sp. 6PLUC10]